MILLNKCGMMKEFWYNRVMKHFINHLLQYPLYYFKEYDCMLLISGLLTVVLTVFAMLWVDNRAKKRYLNEGYLKRKIELEIEIRKILLTIKRAIDELPPKNELHELIEKESFDNDDRKILEKICRTFGTIKDTLKKPEYNIKTFLDEYFYFNKTNKNSLKLFLKSYKEFFKINGFIYRAEITEQKQTIRSLYDFEIQLKETLKLFDNIPTK